MAFGYLWTESPDGVVRVWHAKPYVEPVKPVLVTRSFTVVLASLDPPTADELRDTILDGMGFPLVFDDHPEHFVVEQNS